MNDEDAIKKNNKNLFTGYCNDKKKKLNTHDRTLSSEFMVAYQILLYEQVCRDDDEKLNKELINFLRVVD